ncbi:MAG: hypothetical protein HAW66_00060 [Shewanella sp.]|nr:hypothetical protein [Shewanella sp.]
MLVTFFAVWCGRKTQDHVNAICVSKEQNHWITTYSVITAKSNSPFEVADVNRLLWLSSAH